MIFHSRTLQSSATYLSLSQQGGTLTELENVEIILNYQLLVSCFWRDSGHFESIIKDESPKNEKLCRTRDSCIHTNARVRCTNVLICKMDLEILNTSKERSVVIWQFFLRATYCERASVIQVFPRQSWIPAVAVNDSLMYCVWRRKGRNPCSKIRASMCPRTAIQNKCIFKWLFNLRCLSIYLHSSISEWDELDYFKLWVLWKKQRHAVLLLFRNWFLTRILYLFAIMKLPLTCLDKFSFSV